MLTSGDSEFNKTDAPHTGSFQTSNLRVYYKGYCCRSRPRNHGSREAGPRRQATESPLYRGAGKTRRKVAVWSWPSGLANQLLLDLFQYLTTFFKLLSAFRISSFDLWTCAEDPRHSLLALMTAMYRRKSQLPSLLCQTSMNNLLSFICPTHAPTQRHPTKALSQSWTDTGSLIFSAFTHGPYSWGDLFGSTSHFPDMVGTLESQLRCCYLRMPSRPLHPTQERAFVISVRTGHNKIHL